MWVLPLLGYVGVVLGFAFLTLAIGIFPRLRLQIYPFLNAVLVA
jgi:hypothetical protein